MVPVEIVDGPYFDLLGVPAIAGRVLGVHELGLQAEPSGKLG